MRLSKQQPVGWLGSKYDAPICFGRFLGVLPSGRLMVARWDGQEWSLRVVGAVFPVVKALPPPCDWMRR